MEICIVTLCRSINSGSFWQAKVLGLVLQNAGHRVWYYDKHLVSKKYKSILKSLLRCRFSDAAKRIRTLRTFRKEQKAFSFLGERRAEAYILGSDTIWYMNDVRVRACSDSFWGTKFTAPVMSYAGSVGDADVHWFNDERIRQAVSRWKAIGVRDERTKSILQPMTQREVVRVCDPTLLLRREDYGKMIRQEAQGRYIFLYLFRPLTTRQQQELVRYAEENELRIVSGLAGLRMSRVDESIVNCPGEFLRYMYSASLVVTDTFHGTAFSVNLNRPFVAIERGKNKVRELLEQVELTERLAGESLLPQLRQSIDYDAVNQRLETQRQQSRDFLEATLSELQKAEK